MHQHGDDRARRFLLLQPLARLDERVEQVGAGPGARKDAIDGGEEALLVAGVLRAMVGRSPNVIDRDIRLSGQRFTKPRAASRMNCTPPASAWLSSTSKAIVIGSLAGVRLQHLARDVVLLHREVGGGQPGDRFALGVENADVDGRRLGLRQDGRGTQATAGRQQRETPMFHRLEAFRIEYTPDITRSVEPCGSAALVVARAGCRLRAEAARLPPRRRLRRSRRMAQTGSRPARTDS